MNQAITIEKVGPRLYFRGDTYPIRDAIKAMGGHWDGDERAWWVGTAKRASAESLAARPATGPGPEGERPRESPDAIRLTGKGRYKGRDYYLGATTRDGSRVRLLTLPDAGGKFLDFWADAALVDQFSRYQPREYRGRTEHTTLGSIARFVARQANPATRRGQCYECGSWGPSGEPCPECGGEGSYV